MEILGKLFGTPAKVRLIRLFIFNPEEVFDAKQIIERSDIKAAELKKELAQLVAMGLVRKRSAIRDESKKLKKKVIVKKVKINGFILDSKFPYLLPLKNLLTVGSIEAGEALVKKFSVAGRLKLLIAAGAFIQEWGSRVDLLIVGEGMSDSKLDTIIRNLEADLGRELSYSKLDLEDFEYRLGIHDKLVRDILDYPHLVLVDKIGLNK